MVVLLHKEIIYNKSGEYQNYEIVDADWSDIHGAIVVLKEGKGNMFCLYKGDPIPIDLRLSYCFVRWIDSSRFVLVNRRTEMEANVFIVNLDGVILDLFHAGDGIEDVAVGPEGIWVSYFDEGVYGSAISEEGLVLFGFDGKALFRYHSDLPNQPPIDDCYAMAKGNGQTAWILPYSEFPLVQVNADSRTAKVYKAPPVIQRSRSLCIKGNYGYFYDPYRESGKFYMWEFGKKKPVVAGKLEGQVRGLDSKETPHFISIAQTAVTLIYIKNSLEKYK